MGRIPGPQAMGSSVGHALQLFKLGGGPPAGGVAASHRKRGRRLGAGHQAQALGGEAFDQVGRPVGADGYDQPDAVGAGGGRARALNGGRVKSWT